MSRHDEGLRGRTRAHRHRAEVARARECGRQVDQVREECGDLVELGVVGELDAADLRRRRRIAERQRVIELHCVAQRGDRGVVKVWRGVSDAEQLLCAETPRVQCLADVLLSRQVIHDVDRQRRNARVECLVFACDRSESAIGRRQHGTVVANAAFGVTEEQRASGLLVARGGVTREVVGGRRHIAVADHDGTGGHAVDVEREQRGVARARTLLRTDGCARSAGARCVRINILEASAQLVEAQLEVHHLPRAINATPLEIPSTIRRRAQYDLEHSATRWIEVIPIGKQDGIVGRQHVRRGKARIQRNPVDRIRADDAVLPDRHGVTCRHVDAVEAEGERCLDLNQRVVDVGPCHQCLVFRRDRPASLHRERIVVDTRYDRLHERRHLRLLDVCRHAEVGAFDTVEAARAMLPHSAFGEGIEVRNLATEAERRSVADVK